MASQQQIVDLILENGAGAGGLRARKMFGEYGLYLGDAFFGLICDDRLFLKDTEAGAALLPDAERGAPYPSAKPHLVVPEDLWDDRALLAALFRQTVDSLPAKAKSRA